MPDIFIPADTIGIESFVGMLEAQNMLYLFGMDYADANREELNSIADIESLNAFFDDKGGLMEEFLKYAAKSGITPRRGELDAVRHDLEWRVKAWVGGHTALGDTGFYIPIMEVDDVMAAARKFFEERNVGTSGK